MFAATVRTLYLTKTLRTLGIGLSLAVAITVRQKSRILTLAMPELIHAQAGHTT